MTAGAVCNILSGLSAEGKNWNFGTIKRALRATGKDLPGYTAIEIGGGVVNLPRAWKAAVAFADAGEADKVTLFIAPLQPFNASVVCQLENGLCKLRADD
ncbi:MAG: hypothetical protein ABFS02_12385, partial [Pseudomonadota bacterium]